MKDRTLMTDAVGHGKSVRRIQQMPPACPRNTDQTTAAITGGAGYNNRR
jgi:dihydroorotase